MNKYPRAIQSKLDEAFADTPAVLVSGPRQAGKTTLVRQIAQDQGLRYLTLDDPMVQLAARQDPVAWIRELDRAVIDEVQRAPDLLLAIKKSIDEDRRAGRFLLTGSANLMTLPTVADSLAGRMETLTLLPLSQSEIAGSHGNWIDQAFQGVLLSTEQPVIGAQLVRTVLRGGYPEAIARDSDRRRNAWAQQYIDALIQRDVRDIATIDKLDELPRLLNAIAQTAGSVSNYSGLGAAVNLDSKTTAKYVGIFEQMYLLNRVDAWARNRLKRLVKSPKMQFVDSGLLATLIELGADEVSRDRTRFGNVLETFVYGELVKHAAVSDRRYRIMHYRDADQNEVDFVLEDVAGRMVAIEVKASATLTAKDLKGLEKLSRLAGDDFVMGVVLHDGSEIVPLGDKLWAAPVSSLWGH